MRKAKVIALSCGTEKRRTHFNFGDVVTEDDFAEGMFALRLKDGFLEEITGEEKAPEPPADEKPADELPSQEGDEPSVDEAGTNEIDPSELAKQAIDAQAGESNEEKASEENSTEPQAGEVEGPKSIDDLTKKQIMEKLTALGTQFNANESKETLYNLLNQK